MLRSVPRSDLHLGAVSSLQCCHPQTQDRRLKVLRVSTMQVQQVMKEWENAAAAQRREAEQRLAKAEVEAAQALLVSWGLGLELGFGSGAEGVLLEAWGAEGGQLTRHKWGRRGRCTRAHAWGSKPAGKD